MNKTKIIYFGTDEFVIAPLEALIDNGYHVVAVVTVGQDAPVARFTHMKEMGLKVFSPTSLKDDQFFEEFKKLDPDLCVIASYGKIIPQRYLDIPQFGFLNIHPSLLPKYRGPSPVQSALLNGDSATGVTIIKLDAEMDHGPIIAQQEMAVEPNDNFIALIYKLFDAGAQLLTEILPHYLLIEVQPQSQNHEMATYTKLLKTEDAEIKLDDTVEVAINKIRALNPEPGTFMILGADKKLRLKIIEAEKSEQHEEKKSILKLKNGYLLLKKVQPEGKKPMTGEEFLRGYKNLLA